MVQNSPPILVYLKALLFHQFSSKYFCKTSTGTFLVRKLSLRTMEQYGRQGRILVHWLASLKKNFTNFLHGHWNGEWSSVQRKPEVYIFSRGSLSVDSTMLKVKLNDKDISHNLNSEVLGLHLDESLSFQNYIKRTEHKANKAVGVLR